MNGLCTRHSMIHRGGNLSNHLHLFSNWYLFSEDANRETSSSLVCAKEEPIDYSTHFNPAMQQYMGKYSLSVAPICCFVLFQCELCLLRDATYRHTEDLHAASCRKRTAPHRHRTRRACTRTCSWVSATARSTPST